jgi:hypothetical protein
VVVYKLGWLILWFRNHPGAWTFQMWEAAAVAVIAHVVLCQQ